MTRPLLAAVLALAAPAHAQDWGHDDGFGDAPPPPADDRSGGDGFGGDGFGGDGFGGHDTGFQP
ncbi:MAG: hypothetical protein KC613_16035, partial [Myxococcales bacterium]|nr:hypothetical protein [Myxococcales bacterium]